MRHRARSRKLSRTSAHRVALYRNLVTSLLDHERVQTTDAKAKELRRIADRMITLGKRGSLHARRRALRVIRRNDVAAKVFDELAERYRERPGGYTRVIKLRTRVGDAAPLSLVELVSEETQEEKPMRRRARRREAEEAPAARKKTTRKASAEKEAGGSGARRKKKASSEKSSASREKSKQKGA